MMREIRSSEHEPDRYFILAEGSPSEKIIGRTSFQVIPCLFVLPDRHNITLGLRAEDNTIYVGQWGREASLVQAWRSLKLLEQVPQVDNGILLACWEVNETRPYDSNYGYYKNRLAPFFEANQFDILNKKLLQQVPSTEELDALIQRAEAMGVRIDDWDLRRELTAGTITETPRIRDILTQRDEEIRKSSKEMALRGAELALAESQLTEDESISALFSQLEIGNIVLGLPIGAYDLDWRHTKIGDMDRTLLRSTFLYGLQGESLYRTTKTRPSVIEGIPQGEGVTMFTVDLGKFEHPWWKDDKSGNLYTFTYIRYDDGHFLVKTTIQQPGQEQYEDEYTVSEIRQMIGIIHTDKFT